MSEKRLAGSAQERKNDSVYFKSLNSLVDKLYQIAADQKMTWVDMAANSGLARQTIEHLGMRITRYPQFRTVQLLAHSLGGRMEWVKGRVGESGRATIKITWKPTQFRKRKTKKRRAA